MFQNTFAGRDVSYSIFQNHAAHSCTIATPLADAPQNASIDKVDREAVDPNEQSDEVDRL